MTPAGGTIVMAGGLVTLEVPPGAVSAPVNITVMPATNAPSSELLAPGSAVAVRPAGLAFARPVTVSINLSAIALPQGVQRNELRVHQVQGAAWDVVPGSTLSPDGTIASVSLTTVPTLGLVALPVTDVLLAATRENLLVGDSLQLGALALHASTDTLPMRPIAWASTDTSVASVTTTGLVRALRQGTATITARAGAATATRTLTIAPSVAPLFSDSFESGDFSRRENGASWISTPWMDVTTRIAHTGSRAARFLQGDSREWAELRFGGLPRSTEVFMQFWLYMPSGTEVPSVGPRIRVLGTRNDKFFRLWGTTDEMYGANPGNKLGASIWGDGSGDGGVGTEYEFTPDQGPQWGMGEGPDPKPLAPLVTDANRGRWVRVRIRCRASGADNRSGVIQLWLDDRLVLNRTDLHTYPPGGVPGGFTHGYLLGWANNGFQPGQYTYVDDVWISAQGFPP